MRKNYDCGMLASCSAETPPLDLRSKSSVLANWIFLPCLQLDLGMFGMKTFTDELSMLVTCAKTEPENKMAAFWGVLSAGFKSKKHAGQNLKHWGWSKSKNTEHESVQMSLRSLGLSHSKGVNCNNWMDSN